MGMVDEIISSFKTDHDNWSFSSDAEKHGLWTCTKHCNLTKLSRNYVFKQEEKRWSDKCLTVLTHKAMFRRNTMLEHSSGVSLFNQYGENILSWEILKPQHQYVGWWKLFKISRAVKKLHADHITAKLFAVEF